jgi:hypothetical protein
MAKRGRRGNIAWHILNFGGTCLGIVINLSRINGATVCRQGAGAVDQLSYPLADVLDFIDWSVIPLSMCADLEQTKMLFDIYPQRRANVSTQVRSQIQNRASLLLLLPIIDLSLPHLGLIIVLILVALLFLAVLPQRISYLLILLLFHLVPLDVVLIRNGLDLLTKRVAVFDQDLPLP